MKFVIPAAFVAFIAVLMIISSVSNRSSGSNKQVVPPTPPLVSISIPPELFNVKPTAGLPESTPEPADEAENGEEALFENIGDNVLAVLKSITERPDYVLGSFEPLIGVTDVNGNGCAEILAVYEAKYDEMNVVRYDVWRVDPWIASRLESDVLDSFGEISCVLHLLQDPAGNPYVMAEEDRITSEYFPTRDDYWFYNFTDDESELEYYRSLQKQGHYDTENGDIAEIRYYTLMSDYAEISADEFIQFFDNFTTVYSLDIISGAYDGQNTFSFDQAWEVFG